jgi:hypothetical protein
LLGRWQSVTERAFPVRDVVVQDIVFHPELDDDGEWAPSVTVYFSTADSN